MIKRSEVYRALKPDLFGQEGPTKELAIRILERVDPDSPEVLKQLIQKAPPSSPSATYARDSLNAKRSEVVLSFFDDRKFVREAAWDNIRRNWKEDVRTAAMLLDTVESYRQNPDRIYSTAAILKYFSTGVLQANRSSVEKFFNTIPSGDANWAKTQGEIALAKSKLNSSTR